MQAYCTSMKNVVGEERPEWCDVEFQLSHALETDDILAKAERQTAGLIVLGLGSLNNSFARHLLSNATCPVITAGLGQSPVRSEA